MGSGPDLIVPLEEAGSRSDDLVGGKARALGRLLADGRRVPRGFCIATGAYQHFLAGAGLRDTIEMELGRKSLAQMRWEEIWDAALRIRGAFLASAIPPDLVHPIQAAYRELSAGSVAVRSSAPDEDGKRGTFAGLHESVTDVSGVQDLLDAVRIVWASLWSDAALLYRKELGLDVARSRMAVVVQEFVAKSVSGVAFGRDPRAPKEDRQILEAVPGLCEEMVSGAVDPDRWTLQRSSGKLIRWRPGQRGESAPEPLLAPEELPIFNRTLLEVEELLGYPPDMEWTGHAQELTLLQARPVTPPATDDDKRGWYLSLRPGDRRLSDLCHRVAHDLIPALEQEGARLAGEPLDDFDDLELADALMARFQAHRRWKEIYWEEFIPFAHGARRFGQYYNDAVRPSDPYAFVGLLEHQPMIASRRNADLVALASQVRQKPALATWLKSPQVVSGIEDRDSWKAAAAGLLDLPGGETFRRGFQAFLDEHMNLVYQGESLDDRPDLVLGILRQLVTDEESPLEPTREGGSAAASGPRPDPMEEEFLAAVGPERRDEALEILRIGRLSWRLRDDDNILLGRLQNQLQHALTHSAERLAKAGRIPPAAQVGADTAETLANALRDPGGGPVTLPDPVEDGMSAREETATTVQSGWGEAGVTPRQLIGQPAASGLATGRVRVIRNADDFGAFRKGEILVCDAIQPTMTHLVPLAGAIVERRGGMLIHGAIIARELGVPCVNGVPNATELLPEGELVTVDGHLGIVTVGPPDLKLERRGSG